MYRDPSICFVYLFVHIIYVYPHTECWSLLQELKVTVFKRRSYKGCIRGFWDFGLRTAWGVLSCGDRVMSCLNRVCVIGVDTVA